MPSYPVNIWVKSLFDILIKVVIEFKSCMQVPGRISLNTQKRRNELTGFVGLFGNVRFVSSIISVGGVQMFEKFYFQGLI